MIDSYKFPVKLSAVTFTVLLRAKLNLVDNIVFAKLQRISQRYVETTWKFNGRYQLFDRPLIGSIDRAGLDFGHDGGLTKRLFPKVLAAFQE